ncbi:unnamed protein product [Camellia sinensis]
MTTSSLTSDFAARKLADFLSKHLRAAHVSASSGVSIAAHRANSHAQSFLDRAVTFSTKLIRFLSIDNRATESILRIADKVGLSLELPLAEDLVWEFSLFSSTVEKDPGSLAFSDLIEPIKQMSGYGVATGGPMAWGLCYNKELSPSQSYCDDFYKFTYPCTPGAEYYGRGAIPIYWNNNYGATGEALNVDLLNHPEYIEQNATLAFQAAIWRWMTAIKKAQPSAHDIFVGNWKPTKNDTMEKRIPGFGTTMNVLYGDSVCGQGDIDSMNDIISHYLYYLDLMGVGREEAGPHDVLSCGEQKAFNPTTTTTAASS